MNVRDLQPGDILLHSDTSPAFGARGIRLITGSKFTHCALVLQDGRILEQWTRRRIHKDAFAYAAKTLTKGESLTVVRPKFTIVFDPDFIREGNLYGVGCILDALINHAFAWAYHLGWLKRNQPEEIGDDKYYPMAFFSRLGGLDCSALVAATLHMGSRVWCSDVRCVEPDDFANHGEDFQNLGVLDFS